MREELSGRERVSLALNHREADRVSICDGLWPSLVEQWYATGSPAFPPGLSPDDAFGYDMLHIRPDTTLRLPEETLEETAEYSVIRDANGTTIKRWKDLTFPGGPVDHLIGNRADWEEHKWRARWDRKRVDWRAARRAYVGGRARGQFIVYSGAICWDAALPIVGPETLLYAMADDPKWVGDMFETLTDLCLAGAEEMLGGGFEFDGAFLCDDMGFRSGSLFSLRTYRELFFPQDRRVCDFFRARGMPVILHSCGQVTALIPDLIRAGYTCLNPLEVKAGMDLVALKREYGRDLAFMGGIDVRKLGDPDPVAIEQEIASKLPVALEGGGYIYALDGPVTPDVSLKRYMYALDLVYLYGGYS
jgi:uroporphyrinogen decarboxylase